MAKSTRLTSQNPGWTLLSLPKLKHGMRHAPLPPLHTLTFSSICSWLCSFLIFFSYLSQLFFSQQVGIRLHHFQVLFFLTSKSKALYSRAEAICLSSNEPPIIKNLDFSVFLSPPLNFLWHSSFFHSRWPRLSCLPRAEAPSLLRHESSSYFQSFLIFPPVWKSCCIILIHMCDAVWIFIRHFLTVYDRANKLFINFES